MTAVTEYRSQQGLLRIQTPADKPALWAPTFRELLAKHAGERLPPAFFHYDESGRTLMGAAAIRVVAGHRWVGLLAMDGDGDLFRRGASIAIEAASNHYGMPLPVNIERMALDIEPTMQPVMYGLRKCVIKRKKARIRQMRAEDILHDKIVKMLASAQTTSNSNKDLPTDSQLDIVFHDLKEQGMRLRTSQGDTSVYVSQVNAIFSMRANLKGMWQVGALQARGHGRIVRRDLVGVQEVA